MVMAFNLKTNFVGFKRIEYRLRTKLPKALMDVQMKFGRIVRDSLKREFMLDRKLAPRGQTSRLIKTRRTSKNIVKVFIPLKAHFLDTMKPHYVALKRGRLITNWARKYYGPKFHTGYRSRVMRGKKQGILFNEKSKSFLYVTPHPFVSRAYLKVYKRLQVELSKALRMAMGG